MSGFKRTLVLSGANAKGRGQARCFNLTITDRAKFIAGAINGVSAGLMNNSFLAHYAGPAAPR